MRPYLTNVPRITALDAAMAGDVLRVVTEGSPALRAASALEALAELRGEHEAFRRFLIEPPRGHRDLNACLLLPPFSAGAQRTLVVASHFGYAPVAGSLLIAAAGVLVETGAVTAEEPETAVAFDTAAGTETIVARVEAGQCVAGRWTTAAPRVVVHDGELALDDGRSVPASVVNSGLRYVVSRAADVGVDARDVDSLGRAGTMLSRAAGRRWPVDGEAGTADTGPCLAMIVGGIERRRDAIADHVPVAWISPDGNVAPSPGATGALAAAAHLAAAGELEVGRALDATARGGTFRCWLAPGSATIEAPLRIIAWLDLFDRSRRGEAWPG